MTYFEITYDRSEFRLLKHALLAAFPNAIVDTFVDDPYCIWSLSHQNDTTFISMRRRAFIMNPQGRKCFIKTWEEDNSDVEADELEEVMEVNQIQDVSDDDEFEDVAPPPAIQDVPDDNNEHEDDTQDDDETEDED